jgi:hypothetical protein
LSREQQFGGPEVAQVLLKLIAVVGTNRRVGSPPALLLKPWEEGVQDLVADREALAFGRVAGAYVDEEAFTGAEDAACLGLLHLGDGRDAPERCEHPHVDRHLGTGLLE